jgi:hypothetical protein
MKKIRKWFVGTRTTAEDFLVEKDKKTILLFFLFCVLYAIASKAHVVCVRDGSEHEATRSKAYSPPSSKRLESNIDNKTNELASLTRTRPDFFINFY